MTRAPFLPPSRRSGLLERIAPAVRAVVGERLGVAADVLARPASLAEDLAVDSLDLLELVIDLESAFAICIPEREVDRVRTVADLTELVAKYVWERDHPVPFVGRRAAA